MIYHLRVAYPRFEGINCLLAKFSKQIINCPVPEVEMAGNSSEQPSGGESMPDQRPGWQLEDMGRSSGTTI